MQGGMEVPCQLAFIGPDKELENIRCNLARDISKLAALKSTCPGEVLTEPQCKVEVEEASSLLGSSKSNSVAHCSTSEISSATIDLSNNEDVATSSTEERDVWVRHGKLTLKLVDKAAIELGDELNDKHIQMAQYLAKVQFPPRINPAPRKEKRPLHDEQCANNSLQEETSLDNCLNKIQ